MTEDEVRWRVAAGTGNCAVATRPWLVYDEMMGTLRMALDHGQSSGRIMAHNGEAWICWAWEEIGSSVPLWVGLAVADDAESADTARELAEERLAAELAKYR